MLSTQKHQTGKQTVIFYHPFSIWMNSLFWNLWKGINVNIFPLELIKMFSMSHHSNACLKLVKHPDKNREMADLSTSSCCIYEAVIRCEIQHLYSKFAVLQQASHLLSPHSLSHGCPHHTLHLYSQKVLLWKSIPLSSIRQMSKGHFSLSRPRSPLADRGAMFGSMHLSFWQCKDHLVTVFPRVQEKQHFSGQLWTDLFLFALRDLIKKFLVIDRARRLGNMKVSWLDFLSAWTTWRPTLFHSISRQFDVSSLRTGTVEERTHTVTAAPHASN